MYSQNTSKGSVSHHGTSSPTENHHSLVSQAGSLGASHSPVNPLTSGHASRPARPVHVQQRQRSHGPSNVLHAAEPMRLERQSELDPNVLPFYPAPAAVSPVTQAGVQVPQPTTLSAGPASSPGSAAPVASQSYGPYQGISAMYQVKQLEVPSFSGKASEYTQWRQRFGRLVDDDPHVSEYYKLERLRHALTGGTAEELVSGILDGPGAYAEALRELEAWYGGPDQELERQEREVLS